MFRGRISGRSSRALLLGTAMAVFLIAGACGGGDDGGRSQGIVTTTVQDEGKPTPGGSVSMALEAESTGWQPCVDSHSEAGTMVMMAIYDPLVARADSGEEEPYLAESVTPNDDLTKWTVKLRPGVTFHDGTKLTAAVLKDNFDNGTKAAGSRCAGAAEPITSVEVVDDLTATYALKSPFSPFPSLLSGPIGWPFSPANAKARGEDVSANPVGTGPFVFTSWQRDSSLVVQKNPTYWRDGLPYLDQITFKPIPDEDARLAAVAAGDVDIMHTLRQETVRKARDLGSSVNQFEFIGNNTGSTIINVNAPPVDDKRVRQAWAWALNQPDLIATLGGEGISPAATSFFSKDSPWYSDKAAAGYPSNDQAKGKALIDAYKNDPNRSDGKRPGEPVIVTYKCPPDPTLITLAQVYQSQAAAVGIELQLEQVEQATHINNAIGRPPFTSANYQMNCWRLGGQGDPDALLFTSYSDPDGNAANVTNFSSAEVVALLKQGRESADFEKRYEAYEKLHLIFNEEVPQTYTGNTAMSVVARPGVKGVATWKLPGGSDGVGVEASVVRFFNVWLAG